MSTAVNFSKIRMTAVTLHIKPLLRRQAQQRACGPMDDCSYELVFTRSARHDGYLRCISLTALAEGKPDTNKSRDKPDNSRQKGESLGSLPARTKRVASKMPGPDAAAGQLVDGVDENTKGSEPAEGDENVHWITALVPRSSEKYVSLNVHGQEKKPDEKGISQRRPNNIDTPAMTSV